MLSRLFVRPDAAGSGVRHETEAVEAETEGQRLSKP